jgi:hypothetical protein
VERRNMVSECSQVSSASSGLIGMLLCNYDWQLQLETIERSLKLFGQQKSPRLKSSFEAGRSPDFKAIHDVSKAISHEKTITETQETTLEHPISNNPLKLSSPTKQLQTEANPQQSEKNRNTPVGSSDPRT